MIQLQALDVNNWIETANLSVSEKQKEIFPIPNVYWIGISRYEEHTTLFAITLDDRPVGLIGLGYDEDGTSGFINPFMIDASHQRNGYARKALKLAISYLKEELHVSEIHIGHRKANIAAGKLYEFFGFQIAFEDDQDYFRCLML